MEKTIEGCVLLEKSSGRRTERVIQVTERKDSRFYTTLALVFLLVHTQIFDQLMDKNYNAMPNYIVFLHNFNLA